MKNFTPKPWIVPQPVLIIGTYDKDGKPNAMNAAWGGTWSATEMNPGKRPSSATTQSVQASTAKTPNTCLIPILSVVVQTYF